MSYKGRINQYACACGEVITTIDRDEGTTAFTVPCEKCGLVMYSKLYRVAQDLEPSHEWYSGKIKKEYVACHETTHLTGRLIVQKNCIVDWNLQGIIATSEQIVHL